MGQKLILSKDDEFLKQDKVPVKGVSGGCYCCGQQLHITYNYIHILPAAKVKETYYHVLICDKCEEDINHLKQRLGINKISYDILWLIQDELSEEIQKIEEENEEYIEDDERQALLLKLYKTALKKIEDRQKSS